MSKLTLKNKPSHSPRSFRASANRGELLGKKIVITGGTMGIGLAIAEACAAAGADLILIARHKPEQKLNFSHRFSALDVSNESAAKKFAKSLKTVDGLVNCAGIYGPIGRTGDIDLKKFNEALQINLMGTLNMCHCLLPLLQKSKGKIVNLAGGGAANPFPNYSAYALSKVAIVRLTENLALEYQPDQIDINVIAPGFVLTRLHQETLAVGEGKAGEQFFQKTKTELEKGGVAPEVVAKLVVFLLSSAADGITGKFISAPWDKWSDPAFQKKLKTDKDFCTLRRIDDQFFTKTK